MEKENSILKVIQMRKSTRTFQNQEMNDLLIEKLKSILIECSELKTPFGTNPTIRFVENQSKDNNKSKKIGTYGVIKGESGLFVSHCGSDDKDVVDAGFIIEHAVLSLTRFGIASCWLGGTFKRKSFLGAEFDNDDRIIPAVIPIGISKERTRLVDGMMRRVARSDTRKEWGELFFRGDLKTPLSRESAGIWADVLEMVRIAPSASNKQPWRISLDEDSKTAHLFLQQTPHYAGNQFGFNMQMLDAGIALCHLKLTLEYLKTNYKLEYRKPDLDPPDQYCVYIMSVIIKE